MKVYYWSNTMADTIWTHTASRFCAYLVYHGVHMTPEQHNNVFRFVESMPVRSVIGLLHTIRESRYHISDILFHDRVTVETELVRTASGALFLDHYLVMLNEIRMCIGQATWFGVDTDWYTGTMSYLSHLHNLEFRMGVPNRIRRLMTEYLIPEIVNDGQSTYVDNGSMISEQ
jgi:hypothetical protein